MVTHRTHQLVKLRTDTVENLKKLKIEMGQGSLNSLVMVMIKQMESYRSKLKNSGWN